MPDSAVTSLFEGLGERTRGAGLDQMRPALRAWLTRITEPELAKMSYIEELMKVSTGGEVLLAPPRVTVARGPDDPVLGPEAAAVDIVAFGDLQDADYSRYARVFGRVRDTFGARVHVVFKPLVVGGPASAAAAGAAACAHQQARFWVYHDALIALPGMVTTARLRQIAADVGLDRATFDGCIDRESTRARIDRASDEARGYGIGSSPSFLVNGRLAPMPPTFLPPFEFFTRLVEEELAEQTKAAAPPR
jgi:protein-disulfide isomerase